MGILVALQVQQHADGKFQIWDGERRWRAALRSGVPTVPCDVWPETASRRDLVLAGVVINEQRQPHSCLAVARRLRAVKNQFAESQEKVAARTGLPLSRVEWYLNLFNASDQLLAFFDTSGVPLKTAVELVRYEKAAGEVATRRLMERHRADPLTCREIGAIRRRHRQKHMAKESTNEPTAPRGPQSSFASRVVAAFRRDPAAARAELIAVATKLGLRLVSDDAPTSTPTQGR